MMPRLTSTWVVSPAPTTAGSAGASLDRAAVGRLVAYTVIAVGLLRLLSALSIYHIHNDFSHYYIGGSLYGSGVNVYAENLQPHCQQLGVPYDPTIPYAAHPPLVLALFSGFALLPLQTAYAAWLVVQLVCLVSCLELTRRILKYQWTDVAWLLSTGVFLNTIAVLTLFYYSQVQMLVAGLIYGAILLHLRGRSTAACVLITLASAFKLYPVFMAPWLFFHAAKQPSDYAKRFSAMAATAAICLLLPGLNTWTAFAADGLPALTNNAVKWCNFSAQNLVFMLDKVALMQLTPRPAARWIANGFSIGIFVFAYGLAWYRRADPLTAMNLLLCVMIFAGVITWSHYLSVLFLPVMLLWKTASQQGKPWMQTLVYLVGFVLLMPKLDCTWLPTQFTYARVLFHFYPLWTLLVVLWLLNRVSSPAEIRPSLPKAGMS